MTTLYGHFDRSGYAHGLSALRYALAGGGATVVTHVTRTPDAHFPHDEYLVSVGELGAFLGAARPEEVESAWPMCDCQGRGD